MMTVAVWRVMLIMGEIVHEPGKGVYRHSLLSA